MPIFNMTAARITEPAVGASVWASGSHVWSGNIGTLTAKPRKKARKIHHCRSYGRLSLWNWVTSNEQYTGHGVACNAKLSARMPRSMMTLPTRV